MAIESVASLQTTVSSVSASAPAASTDEPASTVNTSSAATDDTAMPGGDRADVVIDDIFKASAYGDLDKLKYDTTFPTAHLPLFFPTRSLTHACTHAPTLLFYLHKPKHDTQRIYRTHAICREPA